MRARRRRQARQRRQTVQPNGASAALALFTPHLRPREAQIVAQHVQERLSIRAGDGDALAVDHALDRLIAIRVMDDGRADQAGAALGLAPQAHHLIGRGQFQALATIADRLQAPAGERGDLLVAEPGRAAHIVDGAGGLRGQARRRRDALVIQRAADQRRLGLRRADNRGRDAAQRDARRLDVLLLPQRRHHRHVRHRDGQRAAQPQLEVDAALIFLQRREGDVGQQLVRAHHRAAHAGVELLQGDRPLAFHAGQRHLRLQRAQRRDRVVGGRGGDQIPGDGAAIAQRRRAHPPTRLRQRQRLRLQKFGGRGLRVGDHRPQMDEALLA